MTTWSGWEAELLNAPQLPNTAKNRQFLDDWNAHATSPGCGNNPVDISKTWTGSGNCHATGTVGMNIQHYSSHTTAREAFHTQLAENAYSHLLGALKTGDPYSVKDFTTVSAELDRWGSISFSNWYLQQMQAGGPSGLNAPRLHKGWSNLQRSMNQNFPSALHQSSRNTTAALRLLSRGRKVRR